MVQTLIGRSQELRIVVELLSSEACPGVVVVGPAGIGKSSLLGAVGDRVAARGRAVLSLARPNTVSLPYAPLLGLIDPGAPAPLVDQLLATLQRHRIGAAAPLLLCDDIDTLDEASRRLLRLAVRRGRCLVLAGLRADASTPVPVAPLGATFRQVTLSGLDGPATRSLAAEVAGSAIGGVTGARLHAHTAGNPLHITESVRDALETGVLHPDPDGTLRARDALPLTRGLAATIAARLSRLDLVQRRAVELLALGQPLRAEHLQRATVDRSIVEALSAAGLVVDGPAGLSLDHPLHTEAVLEQVPADRRRRHLTRLLAAVEAEPERDRLLRVQLATWQSEIGGSITPPVRLEVARTAMALGEAEKAHQLLGELRSFEAELLRAELEEAANRPMAALQRLEQLRARTPEQHVRMALVRSQVQLLALGDLDAAGKTLGAVAANELPASLRGELSAARALQLLLAGRPGQASELADTVDPVADPRTAAQIWVSTSIAEMLAGDLTSARQQAQEGLSCLERLPSPGVLPFAEVQLECALVYTDLYAGRIHAALDRCRMQQARHLPSGGAIAGLWSSLRGHSELFAGNLHLAREVTADAVAITRAHDPLGHGGLTIADHALAVAMLGDAVAARRLLAELEHRPDAASPRIAVNLARVRAWVAAVDGDTAGAIDHALAGARAAAAVGYHSWAVLAAHDAVRWGAADAAWPIMAASTVGGRDAGLLDLLVRHGRATCRADVADLVSVADGLLAAGARLYAAEVLHQAQLLAGQRGDGRRATALGRRCAGLGVRDAWVLRGMPPHRPLTPRERQVALLASGGYTNRAIASDLAMSNRTVENHLAAVYRKLGVTGRRQLSTELVSEPATDEHA